jgi:hypothetical protein
MSDWVRYLGVPLLICAVTLVAQIYFKWVPQVEDQKRHLRRAGLSLWHVIFGASQIFAFSALALSKRPVQGVEVVCAALIAGLGATYISLLVLKRLVLPVIGRHLDTASAVIRALEMLADEAELSEETREGLKKLGF